MFEFKASRKNMAVSDLYHALQNAYTLPRNKIIGLQPAIASQHFKGYKPKVAVSKIYPVCFEALQSRKDLKNESDVLLLHVVICFKSPIGYNFTTQEILN